MAKLKFTKELKQEACRLKSETDLTERKIIEKLGITKTTFYKHLIEDEDFKDSFKKADQERLKEIGKICRDIGFKRLTEGQPYEEVTIEEVPVYNGKTNKVEIHKKVKKVTKKIHASDSYLMYMHNNLDSENFRHKDHVDITSGNKPIQVIGIEVVDPESKGKSA